MTKPAIKAENRKRPGSPSLFSLALFVCACYVTSVHKKPVNVKEAGRIEDSSGGLDRLLKHCGPAMTPGNAARAADHRSIYDRHNNCNTKTERE